MVPPKVYTISVRDLRSIPADKPDDLRRARGKIAINIVFVWVSPEISKSASLWMLFSLRCTIFGSNCFLLTHVSAVLCGPVALGPREVVDFRRQIYPNNRIRGASSFCG